MKALLILAIAGSALLAQTPPPAKSAPKTAAPAAKREAERAAYDPKYGGYFLGKLAIIKLRTDYAARLGAKFNLRDFHERFMTNGIAPIKAQRMLLLPGDTSSVID